MNKGERFVDSFDNKKSYLSIVMESCRGIYNVAMKRCDSITDKTGELEFSFLIDDNINACTWSRDKDNIWMNTGTVIELFTYIQSVFSSPDYFREIGCPKKEKAIIIKGEYSQINGEMICSDRPKCDIRRLVSEYAALIACNYIGKHEIGHLLDGHTHFLRKEYGIKNIKMIEGDLTPSASSFPQPTLEKSYFIKQGKYALLRRSLEMDADAFASSLDMDSFFTSYENFEYSPLLKTMIEPITIFKLWAFAVYSIYLLFEYNSPTKYDKDAFYLPNTARLYLSLASAIGYLEDYMHVSSELVGEIRKKFMEGVVEAESYFNDRFNEDKCFVEDIKNPKLIKNIKELNDYWEKMVYPALNKYARANLYTEHGRDLGDF